MADDILERCDALLREGRDATALFLEIANQASQKNLGRLAEWALEGAYYLAPKDRDIVLSLAPSYLAGKKVLAAIRVYRDYLRSFPDDLEVLAKYRMLLETVEGGSVDVQHSEELVFLAREFREKLDDPSDAKVAPPSPRDSEETRACKDRALRAFLEAPSKQVARRIGDLFFESKEFGRALFFYRFCLGEPGSSEPELERLIVECVRNRAGSEPGRWRHPWISAPGTGVHLETFP